MVAAREHHRAGLDEILPPSSDRVYAQLLAFLVGFGLVISVYLLAQAVLLWQLASLAKANPVGTRPVIAVFFATAVLTTVLAWMFFFLPPLVINAVIAVFLGHALAPRL